MPAARLRRGSFGDASSQTPLNERALEEHDAAEPPRQLVPSWEAPLLAQQEDNRSRVLPVLQALDYEADPLIDHNGILRVVERGRVIALTRSYPYLDASPGDKSAQPRPAERSAAKKPRPETTTKLSSILGGASLSKTAHLSANGPSADSRKSAGLSAGLAQQDDGRPPAPRYEEYEQTPPSPWSQSPAPSPAIRSDPKENPFFTDAMVDEDSFNPNTSQQQDYSTMAQPETIGVDNSWTVLHIPLTHILLSNPVTNGFTLDSSFALGQRSRGGNGNDSKDAEMGTGNVGRQSSPEPVNKPRSTPIAILSILSPVIPYPSSLRHSLELLAPHLATSFSLCRHYTNLEAELAGL
ncbi:MAG: hypothetical protein OK454_10300, partial [Thaumarchaeota archaeon]|nr:hypothetical protein [Nitrososphaerota archaeon]